jgi:precorrin-6B methylase 2
MLIKQAWGVDVLKFFDLELLFHLTMAFLGISYVYYVWRTKVPVVPTQAAAREVIIAAILAEVQRRNGQTLKIYDLGSGAGGLCLAAARAVPSAQVIGLELAWPAWAFSLVRQKLLGIRNLRYLRGDFWEYDISDGDIILSYLGIVIMQLLSEKLKREAREQRLIISNTFPLPTEWSPIQKIDVPAFLSKQVLLYRQTVS